MLLDCLLSTVVTIWAVYVSFQLQRRMKRTFLHEY
jgi:hypothetical protein